MNNYTNIINEAITKLYRSLDGIISEYDMVRVKAHRNQFRKSGLPYIVHPIAVAQIVASELELGPNPVIAALLHDVVEDTDHTIEEIGERFQIVGVAYQPGGSSGYKPESGQDPLTNGEICLRDAALMQRLGVNAIRVYNVDPSLNHDECASIFNIAGIYMMLDVNSPLPNESLNRDAP